MFTFYHSAPGKSSVALNRASSKQGDTQDNMRKCHNLRARICNQQTNFDSNTCCFFSVCPHTQVFLNMPWHACISPSPVSFNFIVQLELFHPVKYTVCASSDVCTYTHRHGTYQIIFTSRWGCSLPVGRPSTACTFFNCWDIVPDVCFL